MADRRLLLLLLLLLIYLDILNFFSYRTLSTHMHTTVRLRRDRINTELCSSHQGPFSLTFLFNSTTRRTKRKLCEIDCFCSLPGGSLNCIFQMFIFIAITASLENIFPARAEILHDDSDSRYRELTRKERPKIRKKKNHSSDNYVSLQSTHKPPPIRSRGFVCIVADTLRVHYAGVTWEGECGEGKGDERGDGWSARVRR